MLYRRHECVCACVLTCVHASIVVRMRVRAYVRAREHSCACVCVRACVSAYVLASEYICLCQALSFLFFLFPFIYLFILFANVGVLEVSPNQQLLAYGADTAGEEKFQLFFKDLRTGKVCGFCTRLCVFACLRACTRSRVFAFVRM